MAFFFASIVQYLNDEITLGDLVLLVTVKTFKPVARLSFSCLGGLIGWYGFNGFGPAAFGTVLGFLVGYDLSVQLHDRLLGNRMQEQGAMAPRRKDIDLGGIYARCY